VSAPTRMSKSYRGGTYQLRCHSSQSPPSVGSPRFARGTAWGSVPPARRGNLKEGVVNLPFFCELWLGDWYKVRENAGELSGLSV